LNKGQQQAVKYDEFITPAYAIKPLVEYIPKSSIIWECTGVKSNITKVFRDAGFTVTETHKGFDFLKHKPIFDFDIIITNPPYSLKNDFLKRCYAYNKPFALLLPLTALGTKVRGDYYRKNGLQLLVFDKRVQFLDKNNVWFNASWFCWKLLPRDLIFAELDKEAIS
jgi:hypothetical protein